MSALRVAAWAAGIALVSCGGAGADSVTLSGPDGNDGTYSVQSLQSMANAGDTVTSGGLTGISLWGLLGGADTTTSSTNAAGTTKNYGQITTFNPTGANSNSNYDLRYYVVGTGSNGATSVVSVGQIDPNFVGSSQPTPFIAFKDSGGLLSSPELVVPGGPAGSTVESLTSLQLTAVAALPNATRSQSQSIVLSGNVTNPGTYSQFPGTFATTQVTVAAKSGGQGGPVIYTGIPLATFLNANSANLAGQIVVVKGTDGYEAVYSLSELLMANGTANLNDVLAFLASNTDFPGSGIARTVLGGDSSFAHGRWASNVAEIDVLDATTPLPAALPLFASGLGALGLLGWRRKRKNAAAIVSA